MGRRRVVWDSLAIIELLADRDDRDSYWPEDDAARGMARSMAAEMHSGFANLRRELPMNVRKSFPPKQLSDEVREEIDRILQLWAQARARFGGDGRYPVRRLVRGRTSCSRRSSPASSPTRPGAAASPAPI